MKCPRCSAKLMPVDGELFCLQCGELAKPGPDAQPEEMKLEDTADPVLRRAIDDALAGTVHFAADLAPPPEPFVPVISAPVAGQATALLPTAPTARGTPTWLPGVGIAGLAAAALFAMINGVIFGYYADRVYPGVRVGEVAVGGMTYRELRARLPDILETPKLAATQGRQSYELNLAGSADPEAVAQQAENVGRDAVLPVAGWVNSWLTPAVRPDFGLSQAETENEVDRVAALLDRAPSDAALVVSRGNVLLLADKPGTKLDREAAVAAIRRDYGRAKAVSLKMIRVDPEVRAADLAASEAAAQQMVGLTVSLKVRNVTYTPTAGQIGEWLRFGPKGKGLSVDGAGTAGFVAGIPGGFDRVAAVNGLTAAVNARTSTVLSPSTRRATGQPAAAGAAVLPVTYAYCISPGSQQSEIGKVAGSTLGSSNGWTLGGRIHFVYSTQNCNFMFHVDDKASLAKLDPACGVQVSCRIHNDLAINNTSWASAPSAWKGSLENYHTELVNHLVGQWLGFDHPACTGKALPVVLAAPSVTLEGCSPAWYAVPAELQDTKVLPSL